VKRQSVNKALGRLRHLSPQQAAQTVALTLHTKLAIGRTFPLPHVVTESDIDRWFGPNAPVLYHTGFGHEAGTASKAWDLKTAAREPKFPGRDPRLSWEAARDQDLSWLAMSVRLRGAQESIRAVVEERLARFLNTPSANAMEAALRCIAWLESTRFFVSAGLLSPPLLKQVTQRFLQVGDFIERRLYEVPLGGNHYLTHAAGLLYLGRLLPGTRATDRWARRGYAILAREVLRQFRVDGGSYEQSSGYHLFSLEVVLGTTLLLIGQGGGWAAAIRERIFEAAHFASALARPDGSVPLLGDDDSGRLHRWGADPTVREICALAAVLFDDPGLARTASGASAAVSWLCGSRGSRRLASLSNLVSPRRSSQSFESTGVHVLVDDLNCHVVLWSRNPRPPAMVAHAHADHNSVDAWILGKHVLRDPGTGIYLGHPDLRNQLRESGAHTTVTVDGCQTNDFDHADIFFMPPLTQGRRCYWLHDTGSSAVTTTHDGFRRLPGQPKHVRTVYLDRVARRLALVDEVTERSTSGRSRLIEARWHWGSEPTADQSDTFDGIFRSLFSVEGIQIRIYLPSLTEFVLKEPFPWSPSYGLVLSGWRSSVRYRGILPFRMILEARY